MEVTPLQKRIATGRRFHAGRLRRGGFVVGALLLAVIVGAILVGVFALTSSDQSTGGIETNRSIASSILAQSETLEVAVQRMAANGYLPDQIGLSHVGPWGEGELFNNGAAGGGIEVPLPMGPAFDATWTGTNRWYFTRSVQVSGVGLSGDPEIAVLLPGLKSGVCQYLNFTLYGIAVGQPGNPIVAAGSNADWTAGPAIGAATIDLTAVTALNGRKSACIRNADGTHIFYRIVAEQ